MKNKILLVAWCGLLACATTTTTTKTVSYPEACTTIANHGKIDAHELINMQSKTTFEATEYTDCEGNKNIVTIVWKGENNEVNLNLAKQIVGKYFSHFHSGTHVAYSEIDSRTKDNTNTVVYEFMRQTDAY